MAVARIDPKTTDGTVKAMCWCFRTEVRVTLDDVRYGRTESCGQDACNEDAPAMRRRSA